MVSLGARSRFIKACFALPLSKTHATLPFRSPERKSTRTPSSWFHGIRDRFDFRGSQSNYSGRVRGETKAGLLFCLKMPRNFGSRPTAPLGHCVHPFPISWPQQRRRGFRGPASNLRCCSASVRRYCVRTGFRRVPLGIYLL